MLASDPRPTLLALLAISSVGLGLAACGGGGSEHGDLVETAPARPRADHDSDGLADECEQQSWGTNPTLADTDGDGVGDGDEDADGDGVPNASRGGAIDPQVPCPALPAPTEEEAAPPAATTGQVRGLIDSAAGPLAATLRILPGGQQIQTPADGTFAIDLPPGDYEIIITVPGRREQRKNVHVEADGVVLLSVRMD